MRIAIAMGMTAALLSGMAGCASDCPGDEMYTCYYGADRCFCSYFCTAEMQSDDECTAAECHRDPSLDETCRNEHDPSLYAWQCERHAGPLCEPLELTDASNGAGWFCCPRASE